VHRQILVFVLVAALLTPIQLLSQRGGGRGGRSTGGSGAGSAQQDSQEMKDFRRAYALQASPEQISDFKALSKTTKEARELARSLHQMGTADKESNFSQQQSALEIAIDKATSGTNEFIRGLSKTQESELKNLTHDLRKADSEVSKQWKALGQEFGRKAGEKRIATGAEHLDMALEKLQRGQGAIATEMSITE
jgi:hypothetical protein